jgi:Fe-S oxidoreductase
MINLQELADSCIECNKCLDVCPVTKVTGNDSFTPRAKISLLDRIEAGKELTEDEMNNVYLSTRCGACDDVCPVDIPITDIIQRERQLLAEQGREPEKTGKICQNILVNNVPGHMDDAHRFDWVTNDLVIAEKSEITYMGGCWASFAQPEIARSTIRLLNAADIKPMLLKEEKCCGLFLIDNGHLDEAAEHARKYVDYIESQGIKKLVVSCPGCYEVIGKEYAKLGKKPEFKVVFSLDLFSELVREGRLQPRKTTGTVSLRDACPMRKEKNVPRQLISAMGYSIKELFEGTVCCGAPAGVKPNFPEISGKIANLTLENFQEGKTLVSYCPFCQYHLESVSGEPKPAIKDISTLLAEQTL